jgi:hypothetical protein
VRREVEKKRDGIEYDSIGRDEPLDWEQWLLILCASETSAVITGQLSKGISKTKD